MADTREELAIRSRLCFSAVFELTEGSTPFLDEVEVVVDAVAALIALGTSPILGRGRGTTERYPTDSTNHLVLVRRLVLASPLDLVFQFPDGAGTITGLAAVYYGVRRLFGVDLEFRAYREARRAEFEEAKALADSAIARRSPNAKDDVRRLERRAEPFLESEQAKSFTRARWRCDRAAVFDQENDQPEI